MSVRSRSNWSEVADAALQHSCRAADLSFSKPYERRLIGPCEPMELTVRIGVYNIADTLPPPAAQGSNGYDALLYDPRGRMVYAKLSSVF